MGLTIRTCSLLSLIGAALAVQPALAAPVNAESGAWRAFVKGRIAITYDDLPQATSLYRQAYKTSPDDALVRKRTLGLSLISGREKLSIDLARQMTASGQAGLDTRLVLFTNHIKRKQWRQAVELRNELAKDRQIVFAIPVIDAWLATARGEDGLPFLPITGRDRLANSYAAEHRAFILGATGRIDEALIAYQPLIEGESGRALRLRIAVAAMLHSAGREKEALRAVTGSNPVLVAAHAQLRAGKKLQSAVSSPAQGIGELFIRLAADISRQKVTPQSIVVGRLATFLAPNNAETWLVVADMLANDKKPTSALEAVANITPTDPFADHAIALKIILLQRLKRDAEALGVAQAATARPNASVHEWTRLGDIQSNMSNDAAAATSYGRAIKLADSEPSLWYLYVLRGAAYERMGDWKRAEPDFRQAVTLAPDQAVALNYLGYSQLDRGLNFEEAERLIERASILKPNDGAITDSLAWAYYQRGAFTEAVPLLEKAVRLEPAEPTINEHLGDTYWQLGRRMDARYAWKAAIIGIDDDPEHLRRLQRKLDFGLEAGTGFRR